MHPSQAQHALDNVRLVLHVEVVDVRNLAVRSPVAHDGVAVVVVHHVRNSVVHCACDDAPVVVEALA